MGRGASFGEFFKELRRRRGLTLRAFCAMNGFDAGNMSKLERGILSPPQSRQKLEQYAHALELEQGSDDWYEFFDRAAISRGQIPQALLDDQQVLSRLPLVFRTLRGQRITVEQLDHLVELVRRN